MKILYGLTEFPFFFPLTRLKCPIFPLTLALNELSIKSSTEAVALIGFVFFLGWSVNQTASVAHTPSVSLPCYPVSY